MVSDRYVTKTVSKVMRLRRKDLGKKMRNVFLFVFYITLKGEQ